MKHRRTIVMIVRAAAGAALLAATTLSAAQDGEPETPVFEALVFGVELPVDNIGRAIRFYIEAMGFERVSKDESAHGLVLDNGGLRLMFRVSRKPWPPEGPRLNINLSVPELKAAVESARHAGATVLDDEPLTAAIGSYIRILDPDGNHVHLIDLNGDDPDPDAEPKLYNVGLTVTDMDEAEAFHAALGFKVYSRDYLPDTLPLVPAGAAMIVLHPVEGPKLGADSRTSTLVLATPLGIDRVAAELNERALAVESTRNGVELRTPNGHRIRIIESHEAVRAEPLDGETAAAFFEKFKALEGEWMAKSTRGWEDRQVFRVIADGSVVMQISEFRDAPQNTMATMYHLDGDRLMLTHYCAARNQPRLVATGHDNAGRITFEFLDVTGIPSRDHGHMDKAVFRFLEGGGFSERWTWYADGEGKWMEDVVYRRVDEDRD